MNNARSVRSKLDDFEQLFVPEKTKGCSILKCLTWTNIADIAVTDTQLQREKDKLGDAPRVQKKAQDFKRQTNEDYNKVLILRCIVTEGRKKKLAETERDYSVHKAHLVQQVVA